MKSGEVMGETDKPDKHEVVFVMKKFLARYHTTTWHNSFYIFTFLCLNLDPKESEF